MNAIENRSIFEKELLKVIPELRKFACSLTKNSNTADDLLQDTVWRALRSYWQFEIGSNIKAYTFKIMHNCFRSGLRATRFEPVALVENEGMCVPATQDGRMELRDVARAFDGLVPAHREVISLIRVNGLSYQDAACLMQCELGTVKSRMSRADAALRAALGPEFRGRRVVNADLPKKHRHTVVGQRAGSELTAVC